MFRALIIDDNPNARETLRQDIAYYCPEIQVVGEADSVLSGIKAVKKYSPDVLFLDIQLEDGTGFQVLEPLAEMDFKVIFTTGSDAFTLKAIKFSALDYLLKPIDPDELVAAVKKLKPKEKTDLQPGIDVLLENLRNMQSGGKRIALGSADRIHVVQVSDIIRCESQRNYTLFHISGQKPILVTRTMKEFEELLDKKHFLRVHHSHLINLDYLKEFLKADGGYAIMRDGSQVPVSVRKKDELLRFLGV